MPDATALRENKQENQLAAERILLGVLLKNGERIDEVADLSPELFSSMPHRDLFEIMLDLYRQDLKVDTISVRDRFNGDGELVDELLGSAWGESEFDSSVEVLKNGLFERNLKKILTEADAALSRNQPVREVIDTLQSRVFDLSVDQKRESAALRDFAPELLKEQRGVPTGFADLDNFLIPENGSMTVVAGRPSMGKTALALSLAVQVAKAGRKLLFFSLEMSARQVLQRIAAISERISLERIRFKRMTAEEQERFDGQRYLDLPIILNDCSSWTPYALRREVRRQINKRAIELVIVDYLGLLRIPGADNRVAEVTEISRELKAIAKDLDVPLIVLHQLNRASEGRSDKRPSLGDLRDSGAIEQDADMVWFPFRPAVYGLSKKEKNPATGKKQDVPFDSKFAELIVAKHRQGSCRTVEMVWLSDYAVFESAAPDLCLPLDAAGE